MGTDGARLDRRRTRAHRALTSSAAFPQDTGGTVHQSEAGRVGPRRRAGRHSSAPHDSDGRRQPGGMPDGSTTGEAVMAYSFDVVQTAGRREFQTFKRPGDGRTRPGVRRFPILNVFHKRSSPGYRHRRRSKGRHELMLQFEDIELRVVPSSTYTWTGAGARTATGRPLRIGRVVPRRPGEASWFSEPASLN